MYYEINANILPQIRLVDTAVLEPPYVHRRRQPDEYILYIMKQGVLYLKEDQKEYELRQGDILLLDTDFVHEGIKASECEYFYIHFRHPQICRRDEDQEFMENLLEIRGSCLQQDSGSYKRYRDDCLWLPKFVSLGKKSGYLRVLQLIQEAMEQHRNQMENYKTACECRFMEALVTISREALSSWTVRPTHGIPSSYHRVHELLNYLNENYHRQISGAGIEEEFSCNFDYLNSRRY